MVKFYFSNCFSLNNKFFCMKNVLLFSMLLSSGVYAQSISFPYTITTDHPRILINKNGQATFQQKLNTAGWTLANYNSIKSGIDTYVTKHIIDPTWIVSRLQMYWVSKSPIVYLNGDFYDHAGGAAAPVATVRYAGQRDWNTVYATPKLEDIKPYDEDSRGIYVYNNSTSVWEWANPKITGKTIENINRNIMGMAADAAMIYWFTGEEKYAKFALDIYKTYMMGMYYRQPIQDITNSSNLKARGLQTFEIIHDDIIDDVAICYDFLYDYLIYKGENITIYSDVLKRWADWTIDHGNNVGNWNIIQASHLTYLALCLNDDNTYADAKGWRYYLDQVYNQSSTNQTSLVSAIAEFNPENGMWDEAPGYSVFVPELILQCIKLSDNVLNNNILNQMPILKKAVLQSANYMMPNKKTVAFGDTDNALLSSSAMENIISISRKNNNVADEQQFTGLYKMTFGNTRKISTDIYSLFTNVDNLNSTGVSIDMKDYVSPSFYSPDNNWLMMRNGYDEINGMAVSLSGTDGGHSQTNGLNMELYAKGYNMAPDPGRGASYWTADHGEYYSQYPAHNTVVVDGLSNSNSTFSFVSNYPNLDQKTGNFNDISFSLLNFTESKTASSQQRLNAMVRTSLSTGYFIDIFRSKKNAGGDVKHEYIYHNVGQSLTIKDATSTPIALVSSTELSSALGDVKGYNYFSNKKSVSYTNDFNADFSIDYGGRSTTHMNVWMKGYTGRKLFSASAPKSNGFDFLYDATFRALPIPTLIVRQSGEAWNRPFAAILEPYTENESRSITSNSSFSPSGAPSDFVGLNVTSGTLSDDFIFSAVSNTTLINYSDMAFKGRFAIVSSKANAGLTLFLGDGQQVSKGLYQINSDYSATATLVKTGDDFYVMSNSSVKIMIPDTYTTGNIQLKHVSGTTLYAGVRTMLNGNAVVEFTLPKLNYGKVTISINPAAVISAKNIPGLIEAEDYNTGGEGAAYHDNDVANNGGKYRNEGVDVQVCNEGGYNVGWTNTNEWIKYNVNVLAAGQYQMITRVATTNTSAKFRVEFGATNVSGTVSIPNTGGSQIFKDVIKTVSLSAGMQTLRLYIEGGNPNINKITFVPVSTDPVNLLSYGAKADGYRSVLEWHTSSEQNNNRFEIERSADGVNFTILGTLNSKGSISTGADYILYDVNPENGITYYKLVQYDLNGIRIEKGTAALTFSPTLDPAFGQQIIGNYPLINGGFEGAQINGSSTNIPTGAPNWQSGGGGGTNAISDYGGRSGPSKLVISNSYTSNNTNPRTFISPAMPIAVVLPNKSYQLVFWYKANDNVNFPPNYTVVGASTASGVSATYPATTITNYGTTPSVWVKKVLSFTTANTASANGFAAFKMGSNTAGLNQKVDIDDFVMYPGTVEDNTVPGQPTGATIVNTIPDEFEVSWSQPNPLPLDITGYLVVRYTTAPTSSDNLLQKGIYAQLNTVKSINDGLVVYVGNNTSFTDRNEVVDGAKYYYKIYAVDQAFNYSNALQAYTPDQTLPVSLTSFTAKAEENKARLNWTTISEENNDHFEISRSIDGKTFNKLGEVKGNGTSNKENTYQFFDEQPLNGNNYYQLVQYDYDGKSKMEGIRSVNFKINQSTSVSVYPNPTSEQIYFNLSGFSKRTIVAKFLDITGRTIYMEEYQHLDDGTNYQLHLKDKPSSGVYILQLSGGDLAQNIKVLIK